MFGNKQAKIEKLVAKKKGDALVGLLNDKDETVRLAAIAGLGKVGGDPAYNGLVPLLRDKDAAIRIATAAAMGLMGDTKSRVHLEHQVKAEADPKVLEALKAALQKLHDAN